jgi:hypothetical protein
VPAPTDSATFLAEVLDPGLDAGKAHNIGAEHPRDSRATHLGRRRAACILPSGCDLQGVPA